MAQLLQWHATGERFFETGIEKGVLYLRSGAGAYDTGFAWNGLTAVTESPSGAEPTDLWADNSKYLTLLSAEKFGLTIEAYTYPDEFGVCDGSEEAVAGVLLGQQSRATFGLCYRTKVGNEVNQDLGYKLHLVYGCLASPSEKAFQSESDNPEAVQFSWEVSTTPEAATGYRPVSIITIDSRTADATALAALEVILYGDDVGPTQPLLPLPDAVVTAMTP